MSDGFRISDEISSARHRLIYIMSHTNTQKVIKVKTIYIYDLGYVCPVLKSTSERDRIDGLVGGGEKLKKLPSTHTLVIIGVVYNTTKQHYCYIIKVYIYIYI